MFKKFSIDDLMNGVAFLPGSICFADDNGEGEGDGGGAEGEGGGLLDDAKPGEAGGEGEKKAPAAAGVYEIKGADGKVEKIDVPEKFWDKTAKAINTAAVLKSALSGEKQIGTLTADLAKLKGQKPGEVPEKAEGYLDADTMKDGLFLMPDGVKNIAQIKADDPGLKLVAQIAKDIGLTKTQFKELVSRTVIGADGFMPKAFDKAGEIAKLAGSDKPEARAKAEGRINTLRTWADGLVEAGTLSAAEHGALMAVGRTAVGVSALEKVRAASGGKTLPNDGGVGGEIPSKSEWYAKMPDHRTDPTGYEKWREEGAEIFGTGPAGTSQAGLGAPHVNTNAAASMAHRPAKKT